jgi:hypothetical protein
MRGCRRFFKKRGKWIREKERRLLTGRKRWISGDFGENWREFFKNGKIKCNKSRKIYT